MSFEKRRITLMDALEMGLLAVILNMNALKVVLRTTSNALTYLVFAAFAGVMLRRIVAGEYRLEFDRPVLGVLLVFLAGVAVSMVARGNLIEALPTLAKFLAGLVIAYLASLQTGENRRGSLMLTMLISAMYAVFLILQYSSVYNGLIKTEKFNYLNVTLPLGLGLSLALSLITCGKGSWGEKALCAGCVALQAAAMLKFNARGNLVFPVAVAIVLMVIVHRKDAKKLLAVGLAALILAAAAYFLILAFGSEKLLQRFTRILTDAEQEPRFLLYQYSIRRIAGNAEYLFGQGFDCSRGILKAAGFHESYPHNFVLELVGEMGLAGLALLCTAVVRLIRAEGVQAEAFLTAPDEEKGPRTRLFCLMNAGLLFYAMIFFKSYSIYDGYQLFIFLAMMLHPCAESVISMARAAIPERTARRGSPRGKEAQAPC